MIYRFSALLVAAVAVAGCKEETASDPGIPEEKIVVGMELTYPPFEMRGPDNQPDGISVAMAKALGEHLNREVIIEDVGWDGIIPALQTGKIDLIISSMTRTPERERVITFSDGYVTNGLCMLVGKDSELQSPDDLSESGLKVAVKLATTGHTWAERHLEGVDLIVLDEAATCVLEVAQGKADAFIYDQISIYQHWQNNRETTRPVLDPIREETWAIGMRQGEETLRTAVNKFLAEYRKAGKFDELAAKFMAEEKEAFEDLGVPFIFH
ncbi:MAG: transporter substrate-binding domain-containing protein [Verrucomicrobiales bacterium]|nr:transporter substrate-binding domain-containing protein [Verrucomicrobiales bacterium]